MDEKDLGLLNPVLCNTHTYALLLYVIYMVHNIVERLVALFVLHHGIQYISEAMQQMVQDRFIVIRLVSGILIESNIIVTEINKYNATQCFYKYNAT